MRTLYFIPVLGLILFASCARPTALFDYELDKSEAPRKLKFENKSENAESYEWDFGDGNTSTELSPEHKYYLSGSYKVKLTAEKGKRKNIYEKQIDIMAPEKCLVVMETTLGSLTFELSDLTPKHRDNFLKLADEGFYEGLLFHRVIEGFMVQGGDPNSRNASPEARLGTGGPGYQVDAEFNENLAHVKGALAAARQPDSVNPQKRSSGSQFYVVQGKPANQDALNRNEARLGIEYSSELRDQYMSLGGTPFLDQGYTVFGQLVEGFDVLDEIASVATNPGDRPIEDIKILKVVQVK